jgi:hypothetical protein
MPFAASPLVPVDAYEAGFSEGIESWTAVRWNVGADTSVKHNADCHAGRCGFLDMLAQTNHSYVIASPLIPGPTRSYAITFRTKIEDAQDKDQYGAIFSADRSSLPCPGDNTDACFNRYYEFRARYRDDGQKYMEYRLRRIDGHDQNNIEIGEDIIPWTLAEGVKIDEFNKWEIRFRSSGHIYIKANNDEQSAYGRDNKHKDQRYFGLMARSNESSNVLVHFDDYKIVAED